MVRLLLCCVVVGGLVLTIAVFDSGPAFHPDDRVATPVGGQSEHALIEAPDRSAHLDADKLPSAPVPKGIAGDSLSPVPANDDRIARAGDTERARTHPHEYVGGNPWWPRRRQRARERNANPLVAAPVTYGATNVALADDGVHRRAKDVGEKRPWLSKHIASGDDHQFGGIRVTADPTPGAPVRKAPERRLAVDLSVRTNVSSAEVRANGYDVPGGTLSMTLRVPGNLLIEASAPGHARLVRMIRLGADFEGGALPISLELQPNVEVPPPADAGVASTEGK